MVGTNWKGIGMAQRRWINLSRSIELQARSSAQKTPLFATRNQTHDVDAPSARFVRFADLSRSMEIKKLRRVKRTRQARWHRHSQPPFRKRSHCCSRGSTAGCRARCNAAPHASVRRCQSI